MNLRASALCEDVSDPDSAIISRPVSRHAKPWSSLELALVPVDVIVNLLCSLDPDGLDPTQPEEPEWDMEFDVGGLEVQVKS